MEIRGSFIVVKTLELAGDIGVLFDALSNLVFPIKLLGVLKFLTDSKELLFFIFVILSDKFALLSLIELVFFLEFG